MIERVATDTITDTMDVQKDGVKGELQVEVVLRLALALGST